MKKAFITGINGQDGSYLAEFLLKKDYEVAGIIRRLSVPNIGNIKHIIKDIKIYDGDLLDQGSLVRAVKDFNPDEVYNLAAQSFVHTSWEQPILTGEVTALGAVQMLEALRNTKPDSRFYQASSSEMYGNVSKGLINENTPMLATSPYAIAKLYAHRMTINYRDSYGMYCTSGILFNHESPRRGLEFVTRKISYGVACIAEGIATSELVNEKKEPIVYKGKIRFGNIDSGRDWGYAGDYVEAMWLMLQQKKADDFVIATGKTTTVREFIEIAFAHIGIKNWQDYIEQDKRLLRPSDLVYLKGDASKARKVLKWQAKTSIKKLVGMMVDADRKMLQNNS